MKKTQRKDCFRNIRKQKISFLSIIVITLLGVTVFLGIDFTARAMRKNGSDLYNEQNFRDIEIISTCLFTDDDYESLRKVEGIADVERIRTTTAKATVGEIFRNVDVVSTTERINRIQLTEGTMPATLSECVIERALADDMGLHLGDRIRLLDSDGNTAPYLGSAEFTVCGIGIHPDHINTIITENSYVFVQWDAFDAAALDGGFMKAVITIQKQSDADRFSGKYEKAVAAVQERIDALEPGRIEIRINSVKERLESGYMQIEDAKASVRNVIRSAYDEMFREHPEKKLIRWAEVKVPDVEQPGETARYLWITENFRIDLGRSLEDIADAVLFSDSISENWLVSLYEQIKEENAPRNPDDSYDFDAIRSYLKEAITAQTEQYRQLSDACMAWDEGHAAYVKMRSISCRWISYGMDGNASSVQMSVGSGNFANLKQTFSTMFVFVGALVIFATVGKMVDEQRMLVGTTKALGFFNREIFAKYVGFGVLAVVIGTILGVLIAGLAVEPFLLSGFAKFYAFDISKPHFFAFPASMVLCAGVLLAIASIWFACVKLLREPAIRLMQPKTPGVKKGFGGKRGLPLYSRLILLNMRTDIKRVIVTIVSVAGCCALVIIGFTIRSGVQASPERQYKDYTVYDLRAAYDPDFSEDTAERTEAVLRSAGTEYTPAMISNVTYQIKGIQLAELYCGDLQKIGKFQRMNDWKTGDPVAVSDRGVFIPRRVAEVYGLKVGSEMELSLGGVKTATVRVAGIFETYIGKFVVMSDRYYEQVFNEPFRPNTFLVRLNGADPDRLQEDLQQVDGFEKLTRADTEKSIIESSTSMINTVVLLFIFMAAVMAGIVQMNLTNMYVMQKKRELIIMRVNGFSVREVINYVLRETILTTVLGILSGLAVGSALAYWIIRTLEQEFIRFGRGVDLLAWLIAILMTVFFTVIVNVIALRNVRKLKLTDIA